MCGGFFSLAFTDFDVIAVYPVITDLECAESCDFSFFGFKFYQVFRSVLADGSELIQLVVVSLFDDPAFPDNNGRIFYNGFFKFPCQLGKRFTFLGELRNAVCINSAEQVAEFRQDSECVPKARDVSWPGGPKRDTGQYSFNIAYVPQAKEHWVGMLALDNSIDGVHASAQYLARTDGTVNPALQQSSAHAGCCFV